MDILAIVWACVIILFGVGLTVSFTLPVTLNRFIKACAAVCFVTAYVYGKEIHMGRGDVLPLSGLSVLATVILLYQRMYSSCVSDWTTPFCVLFLLACGCTALSVTDLWISIFCVTAVFLCLSPLKKMVKEIVYVLPVWLIGITASFHAVLSLTDQWGQIQAFFFASSIILLWIRSAFLVKKNSFTDVLRFLQLCFFSLFLYRLKQFDILSPFLCLGVAWLFLCVCVIRLFSERDIYPFEKGVLLQICVLSFALSLDKTFFYLYVFVLTFFSLLAAVCHSVSVKTSRFRPLSLYLVSPFPVSPLYCAWGYGMFLAIQQKYLLGVLFLSAAYWISFISWMGFAQNHIVKALVDPCH